MLQSQPCSLQHNPDQGQMPAKLLPSAQPDSVTCKANTCQAESQIEEGILVLPVQDKQSNPAITSTPFTSSVAVLGIKETVPSVVPPCPTNCYQIHQAQSEELHSSQDTYQSNSDEYDNHYWQGQDEETSKPPEDGRRLTKGENGSIHHVCNHLGSHGHLLTATHRSYVTQTQTTYLPQTKCTVNQESYEHQTGQIWSSTLSQARKPQRSSLGQVPNKTNKASNLASFSSSSSVVLPTQGSYPLPSKVPLHYASAQMKNMVNNTLPSTTPHQAGGSALQLNKESHQYSSSVSKQVGRPMLVGVPLTGGLLDHHRASNLQTRPETLSVHSISNLPGLHQAEMLQNVPAKVGSSIQKKAGDSIRSIQSPNKKQKLGADSLDQSLDQINDVTVVSGVDLKEEEEQLLTEPAEKSYTSEELKRFVKEEELKLFLESKPLRQKILGIAHKYDIQMVSEDVERCLSLSIEEWYRSILFKLIRLSKQRCDFEKGRQKHFVTSNIRQQIMTLKKMANEAKDAQEAVRQKQEDNGCKQSERGETHMEDKRELWPKCEKFRKDDDKVRLDATNMAGRQAVGGDDMLVRWELIAEEGRLKRAAETDGVSSDKASKPHRINHSRDLETIPMNGNADKGFVTTLRKLNLGVSTVTADTGRPPGTVAGAVKRQPSRIAGLITVKDVIAVLEMDPHMAKSTLLYRLYNRNCAESSSCQKYDSG